MGLFLVLLLTVPPLQYASSFTPTISDNGPVVNQEDHDDEDEECDPAYDDCTSDSDGDGTIDYWDDCPTQAGPESNYGCPEGVEPDDSDGDGLYDYEDECPYEYGSWEFMGCPEDEHVDLDPDHDGIVNEYDECPNDAAFPPNEVRGCPDSDGDGVADYEDQCPDEMEDWMGTLDGCPDASDMDGDGVPDSSDACPNEYGTQSNGCPVPVDTTRPVISIPNDVTIETSNPDGEFYSFSVTVTDDTDPNPSVSCTPPSGSFFPIGTTQIDCTATDSSGNSVTEPLFFLTVVYSPLAVLDSDGDGVPDYDDDCPYEYGPSSNYGCPAADDYGGYSSWDAFCKGEYGSDYYYDDFDDACYEDYVPSCDPSYPDVCIAPYPPDLDCGEIGYSNFRVVGSDPHGFDGDNDGIGCEVGSPEDDYGGYSSWDAFCKGEYGSDFYYDTSEDACFEDFVDSDGDGVPDYDDDCPYEYGPSSNYGCPDDDYGGTVTVDFDAIDTSNGIVSGSIVENYLAEYGINVIDEGTGTLRDFTIWEGNWDKGIYAIATSFPNGFFRNYGNEAYSYSFYFDAPLDRFEFTRASYDASFGGIVSSSWNAQAFDIYGNSLGIVGEGQGSYYSIPPPVIFSFDGPNIAKVTFYRDSVNTYAGIAQVPLDNLVLTYSSNTFTESDSDGDGVPDYDDDCPSQFGTYEYYGCSSWTEWCKGEYGSQYFYDEFEDVCVDSTDSDSDGVPDYDDSCPYEYGPSSNYGCPEVEPLVSPELERLGTLGMEAYENGDCDLALTYFNQALALHEQEVFVKWFIGAIYSDCVGDHKTALPYLKDALALAKSTPEIPEEIIVEIQKGLDIVKELISTPPPSTTPSTQLLDLTGTWKGTVEFSVWFDYYPAPVTCSYVGNLEMKLHQTGDSVTGTSSLDVTKATTPTGCFSWFESYGYGQISGDVFGSAFSGTYGSNQFTGRFTSDLFEGEFSQQGTNSVSGSFSLMREDAPTVSKSITPTPTPITPPTITPKITPITPPTPTPTPTPITPTPTPTPVPKAPVPKAPTPTPITPTPITPTPTPTPTPIIPVTLSIDTDRTTYNQGNLVTINAEIDGITSNANIAISVIDPSGNIVMTRTLFIDDIGSIPFKILHGTTAGSYKVTASVNINGQNYEDTSQFTIKKDLAGLSIKSVSATDQQGNTVDSFSNGNQGYIKIVLSADSFMSNSLVTVTVLDSDLIVLGTSSIKTSISSADSEIILSFYIPDDASAGIANIYVNAFTDWPSNGGVPLTREGSTEINIGETRT